MIKVNLKSNKGLNLIALVITIAVILILTNIVIYNAANHLKTTKVTNLQTDIENLRDKVGIYYAQYGELPVDNTIEYTNINHIYAISTAKYTGKFYIIDLSAMENITLNYGKDYEKIKNKEVTTEEEINELEDLYIINADSHNIFYVEGIEAVDGVYYTDYGKEDKDKVPVKIIDVL